jgi:hypothetical protein
MPTEGDVIEQKAAEIGRLFMLHVYKASAGRLKIVGPYAAQYSNLTC